MIAQFLSAALSLLSVTNGGSPAGGLTARTLNGVVITNGCELGTSPAQGSSPIAGKKEERPSPEQNTDSEAQMRRVRELIYFFRTYRVFCRDEEWAQTIRELATIGKPAVPELIAELDRTDRDATIRSLAFCLRAIGDPRAIPGLVRAIPKALRPAGSDCGVNIADPELRRFMLAHQNYKSNKEEPDVACGRPVNEILSAIERLTNHTEPPGVGGRDPLRHVFLGGTGEQQAAQRALFVQRQKLWEKWWSEHRDEFVTKEELDSVELPKRDKDLVDMAGVARYGALFPTGANARLGPPRMLRLTSSVYRNANSYLDLDTGRVFQQYDGMKAAEWGNPAQFGSRFSDWYRKNGIDVRCPGPVSSMDLLLWLVDDSLWDTIDAAVAKGEPLSPGREATEYLARFDKTRTDFKYGELATFLFQTREGGRGIIQVFPRDKDSDRYRIRYRMWLTTAGKPNAVAAAPAHATGRAQTGTTRGTAFAKTFTTTLELPGEGRKCLLDLKNARSVTSPAFITGAEIANGRAFPQNEKFARWCRDQGIDILSFVSGRHVAGGAPKAEVAVAQSPVLIGLDMAEARILPQGFEALTVEEVREILGRTPENRSSTVWFTIDDQLAERPDTFAFRTRSGTVGLLQFEQAEDKAGRLMIRYRIEQPD